MKLTKERFIKTLDFIKEQDEKQETFIDALENLSPGSYCDCFIYNDYANYLIELLQELLNDEHDDIGYFLYEMCLDKERAPTDKNGNALYTTAEELYDYLTKDA